MEGATVLVVDDDQELRELLAQLLEDEGYRPILAGDGEEALRCLESVENPPDIMFLDLMMPGMDGYQVLEHLRKNLLQEFPVLVFSAQRPGQAVLQAMDSELRDFVSKPFELEELVIRMKRLLLRSPRLDGAGNGCLRVYALGSLRVYRDDALLFDESWRNKPAKTIFKLLVTPPGQRHPKDMLVEEVWPETDPELTVNRLRVAIHELRRTLEGKGNSARPSKSPITQQEGSYHFDPTDVWLDVEVFEEHVRQGRRFVEDGDLDAGLHEFQRAEVLYQGDFLRDDLFHEWTVSTRERLRESHLTMLAEAAHIHSRRGEHDDAINFCRKILRTEPWREEVYRHLMQYLVAAGRPNEALRAYEECRRALYAELEAEPSPQTMSLRDSIRRGATSETVKT